MPAPATTRLTRRQLEVLELLAKGLTNPEIAGVLGIGLGTVKHHVSAVLEALDVTNRTEAAVALQELAGATEDSAASVPGFGARPLLAVLPLITTVAEDAWLARGLVDDLTRRTGSVRWFPVLERESASTCADPMEAARELGARYVVAGSALRDASNLKLTLRLLDGASGDAIWARQLERPLAGIDDALEEIIESVVNAIEPAVSQFEQIRAARERAAELAIWELCKRAELLIERETSHDHRKALDLIRDATGRAPRSTRAWACLALAEAQGIYLGFAGDIEREARSARENAQRALDLEPEDYQARLALGRALALGGADSDSMGHLESALDRNPSSTPAYGALAGAQRRAGDLDECVDNYQRCVSLSPRGTDGRHAYGGLSLAHFEAERYEAALDCARRASPSAPEGPGPGLNFLPLIPASLAMLGRVDEARKVWSASGLRAGSASLEHSARYVGGVADRLLHALQLAGFDG